MTEPADELATIADQLASIAEQGHQEAVQEPLAKLDEAASQVAKVWSHSWLGYQAYVYYEDLATPPPEAVFSQEWGLKDTYGVRATRGKWRQYDPDEIVKIVWDRAKNPDLTAAREFNIQARQQFDSCKQEVLSIIETELNEKPDTHLAKLRDRIADLSVLTAGEVAEHLNPKGQLVSRDLTAISQGNRLPPHIRVRAEVMAIQHNLGVAMELGKFSRQAQSHLLRKNRRQTKSETQPVNIFIGHGRSPIWRELKEFLKIDWDCRSMNLIEFRLQVSRILPG